MHKIIILTAVNAEFVRKLNTKCVLVSFGTLFVLIKVCNRHFFADTDRIFKQLSRLILFEELIFPFVIYFAHCDTSKFLKIISKYSAVLISFRQPFRSRKKILSVYLDILSH